MQKCCKSELCLNPSEAEEIIRSLNGDLELASEKLSEEYDQFVNENLSIIGEMGNYFIRSCIRNDLIAIEMGNSFIRACITNHLIIVGMGSV